MLEKDKGQQTCERLTVDIFLFQEKKRGKDRDGEGTGLRQVGGREPARMTLSLLAHKTAHAVVQTLVATTTATPIHTARLWAVDLVSVVQVRFGRLRLSSPAVLVFPRLAIATKKQASGRLDGYRSLSLSGARNTRQRVVNKEDPACLSGQHDWATPSQWARFPLHRVNLDRLTQRLRLTQDRPHGRPRLAVLPLSEQPRSDDSLTSFDRVTIE